MCRMIVLFINGYLRTFVEGQMITIRGETVHVPNSPESWSRILENVNSDLETVSVKVIFDEWDSNMVTDCLAYFSGAHQVRLESIEELYQCLSYSNEATEIFFGQLILKREGNGSIVAIEKNDIDDSVSFDEIFNVSNTIRCLSEHYSILKAENRRLNNKLKKLQKILMTRK